MKKTLIALSIAVSSQAFALNVYNWNDYNAPSVIADYKKSNPAFKLDFYDSNEMLQGKLLVGNSKYDVAYPSHSFATRFIQAGAVEKVNYALLPNAKNIDPMLLNKMGALKEYAVPYSIGYSGIAINADKVKKILGSLPSNEWDLLFNASIVNKLKAGGCPVSFMESSSELLSGLQIHLGQQVGDYSTQNVQAMRTALKGVKPSFYKSSPIDDLASGTVCVAHVYNGDANIAKRNAKGHVVTVLAPSKGAPIFVDNFVVPKGGNVNEAMKWIDFNLRADNALKNHEAITYQMSVNVKSRYQNDPTIILTKDFLQKSPLLPVLNLKDQKIQTRLFQDLKTNRL